MEPEPRLDHATPTHYGLALLPRAATLMPVFVKALSCQGQRESLVVTDRQSSQSGAATSQAQVGGPDDKRLV